MLRVFLSPPPHNSRIDSRECHSQLSRTGQIVRPLPHSLDQVMRLRHKLIDVVIVAVVLRCGCRLGYRYHALTHGNLSAPRGESESTNKELRFRALLHEHETELSLTVA
jgi:hypothetical protein